MDTISVAVQRLLSITGAGEGMVSDGLVVLIHRKRVVHVLGRDVRPAHDGRMLSPTEISVTLLPSDWRSVLLIRSCSNAITGSERFTAFGLGEDGGLHRYSGPLAYLRDADLPQQLRQGQVVYARVRVAWFIVPLPLTFEPRRLRFVPEVSGDAVFPATGTATFRGSRDGSSLIRLFSSTGPDARSMSLPLPPNTTATVKKAFLPSLIDGYEDQERAVRGMAFVDLGSLAGWLPDSLFDRFAP